MDNPEKINFDAQTQGKKASQGSFLPKISAGR